MEKMQQLNIFVPQHKLSKPYHSCKDTVLRMSSTISVIVFTGW